MNLIILAAGKGMRLDASYSRGMPKSLLPIREGVPYLLLQLRSFDKFRFEKKIIVGGFAIEELGGFLRQHGFDDYSLLKNDEYEKGNLYSLKVALPQVPDGFFVFNADHYYSFENYQKIFSAKSSECITVYCDQDRVLQQDDMKVDGMWQSGLKKMSKEMENSAGGYVGVTHVPTAKMAVYRMACVKTEENLGDKAHVENVLNLLAENGEKIRMVDISGSWWVEIDTPEDLKKARQFLEGS